MYEDWVKASSSDHVLDPDWTNVPVYHWHYIEEYDEEEVLKIVI